MEVEVALDSGCAKHCTKRGEVPGTVEVVPPPAGTADFVGAGGHGIRRHGKVKVVMIPEEGEAVENVLEVADVTRSLHSVGQITDTSKEVLITQRDAFVVPAGALSKFLKGIRVFAKYKRRGGLYLAKMRVRDPKAMKKKGNDVSSTKTPFQRQGATR